MASSAIVAAVAGRISAQSRARKWQQFLNWAAPRPQDTVLDIGVNTTEYSENDNYLERHYPYPDKVTALATNNNFDAFRQRYPKVRTAVGDGTSLPFADSEFSIAYSNAVIEHVGDHAKQRAFLREMHRVGCRGYLTTPNRTFPVEVHTRVPLLHLILEKDKFDQFLCWIGKEWATGDYMNLLSERELRQLLHDAGIERYRLIRNRLAGLTMTFTVMWSK